MPYRRLILAVAAVALCGAPPSRAADTAAVKAKAEPCAACHGEAGISQLDGVPSIAGQPDQFTQWQLVYFRGGTRKNEAMTPAAAELTDADIRALGAYFAGLKPPAPPAQADPDPALSAQGAKLAAQRNCASCHQETYAGQQAIARLAGQREEYLFKALHDFKSGARTGGGVAAMPSTVYGVGDDDLKALAHFIAWKR